MQVLQPTMMMRRVMCEVIVTMVLIVPVILLCVPMVHLNVDHVHCNDVVRPVPKVRVGIIA